LNSRPSRHYVSGRSNHLSYLANFPEKGSFFEAANINIFSF